MVGDADRLTADVLRDRVQVGEDLGLDPHRVAEIADPVELTRREDHERGQHDAADRRPAPAPRMVGRQPQPAEHARAAEHGQDRRRHDQIAGEDRQACRGQDAERHDREEPGGHEQPGPAAHERQHEDPARRRTQQRRFAQDLTEPARHRGRHVVEAGDPSQRLGVVARVGQRVVPVAGDDLVVHQPQKRRGGGQRKQPEIPPPDDVGEREQPRFRPQQTGQREQDQRPGRAPAGAPRPGSRPARAPRTGCRRTRARRSSAPGAGSGSPAPPPRRPPARTSARRARSSASRVRRAPRTRARPRSAGRRPRTGSERCRSASPAGAAWGRAGR